MTDISSRFRQALVEGTREHLENAGIPDNVDHMTVGLTEACEIHGGYNVTVTLNIGSEHQASATLPRLGQMLADGWAFGSVTMGETTVTFDAIAPPHVINNINKIITGEPATQEPTEVP